MNKELREWLIDNLDWKWVDGLPALLKNDREFILAAVKQNGLILCRASDELKDDKEIVLAAIKDESHAFYYASKKLQNDREIVRAAVKQNGRASDDIENDIEFLKTVRGS